jgi:hypothetical protein
LISKRDLLVFYVVLIGLAHVAIQPCAANAKRGPATPLTKLRKIDRERAIAAKLRNKKEVMLVVAAKPGMNAAVVRESTNFGAVVRFREDSVDYLRLKVPVDRIYEIAGLSTVEVVAVNGVQLYKTSQDIPVGRSKATPPPDKNTATENPFLPTADIGAPQFIRDHPTFDGRGVTIANVDGNSPDTLAPELQTALSIDGSPLPKFSDVINALDPSDDESPLRVEMSNEVEARNGRFEWKQVIYISPADGNYRLGFFDIDAFGGGLLRPYLPQLSKDKNSLPVLWQEQANLVWVDTNLDQSFADETALTDFNSSYRAGVLGKDDPATPLRETIAFTILTNPQYKLIYLAPLANGHATATASVAAGHNFFGGKMNGVAPGARIASVLRKSLTHSFIEAMILTMKNPKVDIVSLQWVAIMPPQDGHSVVGVIFRRLIEKYNKPIFSGANNSGPGLSTHGEQAVADKVISVGGYVNKLTWQSNYGVSTAANDTLANLAARGPRVDGGFKPDLIAPAATVAANFGIAEYLLPPPFQLPPGYSSGAGTSYSCPMVAGAAALLISAAKQSGVPYDAEKIAWALKTSARYLPGIAAHEQGNGLVNVAAAWEALKRAPAHIAISSSVKINVAIGPDLKTPNHGPGIFEREGWQAGQTGQRTIMFTRTSGRPEPVDYVVRWTGNDGSFSSASKIQLPLNKPAPFPVTIDVQTSGVHSAILNLDDTKNGARSVYQVMNTVIAAEQFRARENYTVTRDGTAEYPGYTSYFLNVPANASALKVDVKIQQGIIKLRFMRPTGKEFDNAHDTPVRWPPEYHTTGSFDRIIADPEPGVWQVIVENENLRVPGDSETRRARFRITAAVYGAESRVQAGLPTTSLGSAFSTHTTIAHQPIIYDIDVPPGAGTLRARIDGPLAKAADVDLYLYLCAKECELKAFSARGGAHERVAIAQPTSGKWKVVIDPVSVPSSALALYYTDLFTHSAFASLTPLPTNRRVVAHLELMTPEPATVRYEYNAATKTLEPIKERITLAETLIDVFGKIPKH